MESIEKKIKKVWESIIGLFNSSISQCNITNLYSWQKDKCYFNYIDCYKLTTPKT